MVIDNKFEIGDEVYLKTDIEQYCRIIIGMNISKVDISYTLSCGIVESTHYDFEISTEKDVLITSSN